MNEFFGEHPNRPDHPDFWHLSEIVLEHDATSAETGGIEAVLAECIDTDSVGYMAVQRAVRAATSGEPTLLKLGACFIDGFALGVKFQQRYGKESS